MAKVIDNTHLSFFVPLSYRFYKGLGISYAPGVLRVEENEIVQYKFVNHLELN